MTPLYDLLESRPQQTRAADDFGRLAEILHSALRTPAYAERLKGVDPDAVSNRDALALLPLLHKSELIPLQKSNPPFGGLVLDFPRPFSRLFASPGPIFEPEIERIDPWNGARALFAAGFRAGDIVLNTFSYHLTPGGFMFDASARALGCHVIPAGPGNVEAQLDLIETYAPHGFVGTPDFLRILIEAAKSADRDISSIQRAVVTGAAFPRSLQDYVKAEGIEAFQVYASADVGFIAYETPARQGMVVNENVIVEIVVPGTRTLVSRGEIGEIVLTSLDPVRPWIRLALGDLTAELDGQSPCGRTNMRIRGWLGRSDESTKIKGMFVRPEQVSEICRRHSVIEKARLVIGRQFEMDTMTLKVEVLEPTETLRIAIEATLHAVTKLRGAVLLVSKGSLPTDGKLIADER